MKEEVSLDSIRKADPNALSLVLENKASYYIVKRLMDFALAFILLILLSPLMFFTAVAIFVSSPGPILFAQERMGAKRKVHGHSFYWKRVIFKCYKFRTMKINVSPSVHQAYIKALIENDEARMAVSQGAPKQPRKFVYDPRIIPPGRFIRELGIDVLPQLWNVLLDDMSLVGPSPAIPYEVEMYKQWHFRRLEAQPGITGLQQVMARHETDFDRQVQFDVEYIDNQSLWLDLKIMIMTLLTIVIVSTVASFEFLSIKKQDLTSHRKGSAANAPTNSYRISVSHPKLLSLRFEAPFLFQVYPSALRSVATKNIKKEFTELAIAEYVQQSTISIGQVIKVNFFSPDFVFSESVTKEINDGINKITFLGKPKDTCVPGMHKVLVSISDAKTNQEFESLAINVHVVDFAFDHVSRPLLSRVSSAFLGLSSLAMFILTFLQEIDKTFGLTSGTAAAVVALAVYVNFFSVYKRILQNTP
jgi:lipopolysaccharide/colanic/teichoic acid biosynthesis glycosyltransferase